MRQLCSWAARGGESLREQEGPTGLDYGSAKKGAEELRDTRSMPACVISRSAAWKGMQLGCFRPTTEMKKDERGGEGEGMDGGREGGREGGRDEAWNLGEQLPIDGARQHLNFLCEFVPLCLCLRV